MDSGVPWLGQVPSHWQIAPLFSVLKESYRSNQGMIEDNLLSLSYGKVVRKSLDSTDGLLPTSFEGYQVVEPNEIILRLTDLQNDQRSLRVGLATERGIITSAYLNLCASSEVEPKFLFYQLYAADVQKTFYALGAGVRQSIGYFELRRIQLAFPLDSSERRTIAEFLDIETDKIDRLIGARFRPPDSVEDERDSPAIHLLRRLSEYRSALIIKAATGQIDVRNYKADKELAAVCQ
jgi:type I restriction enzyme, S subunit